MLVIAIPVPKYDEGFSVGKCINCIVLHVSIWRREPKTIDNQRHPPPWLNEFSLVAKALNKKTASPSTRLTTRKTQPDGRKSFTGLSKALTASSGYTKQFGNAMALCALGNSSNEVLRKLKSI